MRPELDEHDISRQLARRASSAEWHAERVLPAVRRSMAEVRTERVAGPRWAALAGLAGLLGVLVILAVALPRLDLGPSASPSPAPPDLVVLSTEEFAARLAARELDGVTVLVDGRIDPVRRRGPPCAPPDPCFLGEMAGVEPRIDIASRAVATTQGDEHASEVEGEDVDWPWWSRLQPRAEGVLVLFVDRFGMVEYLGTARAAGDEAIAWAVADVRELDVESVELEDVLVVEGWLTQLVGPISGRPPDPGTVLDGLPSNWSGNPAWIAPVPVTLDPTGYLEPEGAILVQNGAMHYVRGAREAIEPVPGQFIVARRLYGGGCPENRPPCWGWQLIGVLWHRDPTSGQFPPDVATPALPTAPPTPSKEPAAGMLSCRPWQMGGSESSPAPVGPLLDVRLLDRTGSVVDCAYFSEFATLREDSLVQARWHNDSELALHWNVARLCPSSAVVEWSRRPDGRYGVTVDQSEVEDCGAAAGRQGVVLWFDSPAQAEVEARLLNVGQPPLPPSVPLPASWELVPAALPTADSRSFEVIVHEHACASGESPEGRILAPQIEYGEETIEIRFMVQSRRGINTCPGAPGASFWVEMSESIGTRQLVDSGAQPPTQRLSIEEDLRLITLTESYPYEFADQRLLAILGTDACIETVYHDREEDPAEFERWAADVAGGEGLTTNGYAWLGEAGDAARAFGAFEMHWRPDQHRTGGAVTIMAIAGGQAWLAGGEDGRLASDVAPGSLVMADMYGQRLGDGRMLWIVAHARQSVGLAGPECPSEGE